MNINDYENLKKEIKELKEEKHKISIARKSRKEIENVCFLEIQNEYKSQLNIKENEISKLKNQLCESNRRSSNMRSKFEKEKKTIIAKCDHFQNEIENLKKENEEKIKNILNEKEIEILNMKKEYEKEIERNTILEKRKELEMNSILESLKEYSYKIKNNVIDQEIFNKLNTKIENIENEIQNKTMSFQRMIFEKQSKIESLDVTVSQLQNELLKSDEKYMRLEKECNIKQNEICENEFKWINKCLNHKKEIEDVKRLHCKELEMIQTKIFDSIQKKDNIIEILKNQIKELKVEINETKVTMFNGLELYETK